MNDALNRFRTRLYDLLFSVPVRYKIVGIALLPVLILGIALNYWITTGLSDWLSYLLTDVRVEAAMRAGGRSVVFVTFLAAIASITLAWLLTFLLTRPLLAVREMAQRVAAGELDVRAPVWSNDEIGEVARSINTMTDHLVQTQAVLTRTNRRLAAINRVILAADRETQIHDVLYAVLAATVDVMELETGWVYLRDPERNVFHLASWYQVPPELQPYLLHEPGDRCCRCQEKLAEGTLGEDVQVRNCRRLERAALPGEQTRHISLPIEARGELFGVLNLHCSEARTLSNDDEDVLTAIAAQVGEIVANAWLRLKLAEKEMARQLLLESLVEAQEEERSRLARELHDGAGQMLTNLLVRIKRVERRADSEEVRAELGCVLDSVSDTIEQVRELSYRLRPAALEEFGLCVALETLVEEMVLERDLDGRCDLPQGELALPGEVEVTLYRIAQEALTNVLRHAHATRVEVTLRPVGRHLHLLIEDDGRGFTPSQTSAHGKRHLGLISMQERAAIIGAAFDVYSAPGAGTTVEVRVPRPEAAVVADGPQGAGGRRVREGARDQ